MSQLARSIVVVAAGAILALPVIGLTAVGASASTHRSHVEYVANHAWSHASGKSCQSAKYSSIGKAVAAAQRGDTVVVCGGTYREGMTITKSLNLVASRPSTIDATKQNIGVAVRSSWVTVRGFTIRNAIGEGVLVMNADHATVDRNVVKNNDQGGRQHPVPNTYPQCQAQGGIPGDCGEGIHLWSSKYSTVSRNVSTGNTGGILVTDETGPSAHNRILRNVVNDNSLDCGVTVVGHNPAAAPGGKPAPKVAGVYSNLVSGNVINHNGGVGHGGGVILATPFPGGAVYDNTVVHNSINGNGLSGVTVHSHAPGQYLNGNVVRYNVIGTNNVDGDTDFPVADQQTTGVFVGTVAPLSITVKDNVIKHNHIGIWTTGPATVVGAQHNKFQHVTVPVSKN